MANSDVRMEEVPPHQDRETTTTSNSTQPQEPKSEPEQQPQPPSSSLPPPDRPTTAITPPLSTSPRSFSHHRSASPLSIDLSHLPALSQPTPPSNTLIITQLNTASIFHPASLATIRQHITSLAPLHSFSPLKSFHRIVCSFYDTLSAITVRQHLDGATLLANVRTRVYFGEPTPIGETTKYLDRPDAGRLLFISPPPSPPVGWEVRDEDPPNKEIYASDLAEALAKLSGKIRTANLNADADGAAAAAADDRPVSRDGATAAPLRIVTAPTPSVGDDAPMSSQPPSSAGGGVSSTRNRSRSSTIIYDPGAHGDSPALPAVMVEDTTMDSDEEVEGDGKWYDDAAVLVEGKPILAHTARPPVELMNSA